MRRDRRRRMYYIKLISILIISVPSCRSSSSPSTVASISNLSPALSIENKTKKKKRRRNDDVLVEDGDINSIEDRKRRHRGKVVVDDDDDVLLPIDDDDTEDVDILDTSKYDDVLLPLDDDDTEGVDILDTSTSEDTLLDVLSPTINVTRNETSESMDFLDESNPDTTYKYSKHKEEEIIDEVRPLEHLIDIAEDGEVMSVVDQSTTTPVMKASTHSTQEYENIQLIEKDSSNRQTTVTVKVSRQHKKQTVHITNKSHGGLKKKKSSSLHKPRKATAATGKGGECLRRIKREWKDAVKTGIAYDWVNMRTINNTKQRNSNNQYVRIGPYGKNLLRWHFSVLGPANSSYENGVYHGRVLLPKDYPGSPPRVQMLTPSGRFVCGADICLSASNYHPETWSPRWTVISLVNALRLHMLTTANEIGGVNASEERRREYAQASRSWRYPGVDHAKMINIDGIFPLLSVQDADCDDDEVSSDNELVETNEEEKVERCDTSIDSVAVSNNPSPSVKRKKKSAKSKSAKATDGKTSRAKRETSSSEAAVSRDDNNNNDYEMLPFLIKRLIIEVLKLPLRIVFILMKLLGIVEYCLKAIINSL